MLDDNKKEYELVLPISLESYILAIQKFNQCISRTVLSYQQIDKTATDALDIVIDSHVPILLNTRAYSSCMQGHLEKAPISIQKLIEYAPTSPIGYLSKGNILSLYGYQTRAIKTYDEGLQHTLLVYPQFRIRFSERRNEAVTKNRKRIDVVTTIPYDVGSIIIKMLPKKTQIECLNVSRCWRKVIIGCAAIWKKIVVSDEGDDYAPLTTAIMHIAPHVEHLTLDTRKESTRFLYLQSMKDGLFSKLVTLKMTEQSLQHMPPYFTVLSIAFWNTTKQALNSIDLNFGDYKPTVTLVDVLLSCNSLSTLSFSSTTTPMNSRTAGNFTLLQHQNVALINLQLKFKNIASDAVDNMLQKCNQIRRLIISRCDNSVLQSFIKHGANIKSLYINAEEHEVPASVLNDNLKCIIKTGKEVLHIDSGTNEATPSSSIMPILYKNQATLKILHTDMKSMDANQLQQLYTAYPDFRLDALTHLRFYAFAGTTSFILDSIRNATALSYMDIRKIHDFHRVATFLSNIPNGLKELRIKYVKEDANIKTHDIIELFNRHARLSEKSPSSALERIHFISFSGINDKILVVLANIKTLKGINFTNLPDITENGIRTFFNKIDCYQLTYIRLSDMDSITDQVICDLQEFEALTCLELDRLKVTDEGILAFAQKANGNILKKLLITECPQINGGSVYYAKSKIKIVVH